MCSDPSIAGNVKSGASIATGPGVFTRTGSGVGVGIGVLDTGAGLCVGVAVSVAVFGAATAGEVSGFGSVVATGAGGISGFDSAVATGAGGISGFDSAVVAVSRSVSEFNSAEVPIGRGASGSDPALVAGAGGVFGSNPTGAAASGVAGIGVGLDGGCSDTADGAAPACRPEVSDEISPHATVSSSNVATKEVARKPQFFHPKTELINPSCNCPGLM